MESCTIIPVHPPHYEYALGALRTHEQFVGTNLYFVFSSDTDLNLFKQTQADGFNYLVYPDKLTKEQNVITAKKFYAINELSKQYKYIGVFDSETLFVKEMDSDIVYKEICDSKIFKANVRRDSDHISDVAEMMGYLDNETLIQETEGFTLYWWFNEICVYEASLFNEFYEWLLNHPNASKITNEFKCFDYLLYSIWLVCNKGYKIKKYMSDYSWGGAAIETNYNSNEVSLQFGSYQDRNINHVSLEHIKVQIMLDRDSEHCKKEGAMIKQI